MRDQPTRTMINLTGFPIAPAELQRMQAEFDQAQELAKAFPPPSGAYLAELQRQHDTLQEVAKASPLHGFLTRARAL